MILASATVHTSLASVQNRTEMTTEPHSSAMQKNRLKVQCSMTCAWKHRFCYLSRSSSGSSDG